MSVIIDWLNGHTIVDNNGHVIKDITNDELVEYLNGELTIDDLLSF